MKKRHSQAGTSHRWRHALLTLLLGSLLPWAAVSSTVQAQNANVITVNSTDDAPDDRFSDQVCDADGVAGAPFKCTLRAALMEANFLPDTNTVQLPSGTYTLSATADPRVGANGVLRISTNMTLIGTGASQPVIDGSAFNQVLLVSSFGGFVRLQNLSIRGGGTTTLNGSSTSVGGGVRFSNPGSYELVASSVSGNRAVDGGGIAVTSGASLVVQRSSIANNTALSNGGGIFVDSSSKLTVQQSTIAGNTAQFNLNVDESGRGGGIFAVESTLPQLQFDSVRLLNNTADTGGGGIFTERSVTIHNSTISGNRALGKGSFNLFKAGGGLFANGRGKQINVNIERSTIADNISLRSQGGGLFLNSAVLQMITSTVSGNEASRAGGISSNAAFFVQESTITRNSGSGIQVSGTGNKIIDSTIIANNNGGDCFGTPMILGVNNLTSDASCTFGFAANNLINTDPKLGPLAFNGGPTQTHMPQPGSLAIEGGVALSSVDQRNIKRPQGGKPDIGAVEASSGRSLGSGALMPAAATAVVDQPTPLTSSWTTPAPMAWTELSSLEFQLLHENSRLLLLRLSEGVSTTDPLSATEQLTLTNGLTLYNSDGTLAGFGMAGDQGVLESDTVAIDLAQSRLDGPPGQVVSLTLAVRFKQSTLGKTYRATLLATEDAGGVQGPDDVGTVTVVAPAGNPSFRTYLPIVAQ